MSSVRKTKQEIINGNYDSVFEYLYGKSDIKSQTERSVHTLEGFCDHFGKSEDTDIRIYSSPGRTEIGGNHTDHQHGCVLAGSANMDSLAIVARRDDGIVRIKSIGHEEDVIDLHDLSIKSDEKNTSKALIRGTLSRFKQLDYKIGGFDAFTTSNVIKASGLSSSAAFEVLVGTILNYEFNGGLISPVKIAQIGQYAENEYMGKPSGLLDQMSCSVGGFVFIDFKNPQYPVIEKIDYDFKQSGYTICIVDTGGNHADLTPEYGKIPGEMKSVAAFFGKEVLREVDEREFYDNLTEVRKKCGDRAVLRAIHYFGENVRASLEAESLRQNKFDEFLRLVKESGESSYKYLQNVFVPSNVEEQGIPIALCLSEKILGDHGVCRVHGGGFAGVIQAFVPNNMVEEYKRSMCHFFGENSCTELTIRPIGGFEVTKQNKK